MAKNYNKFARASKGIYMLYLKNTFFLYKNKKLSFKHFKSISSEIKYIII